MTLPDETREGYFPDYERGLRDRGLDSTATAAAAAGGADGGGGGSGGGANVPSDHAASAADSAVDASGDAVDASFSSITGLVLAPVLAVPHLSREQWIRVAAVSGAVLLAGAGAVTMWRCTPALRKYLRGARAPSAAPDAGRGAAGEGQRTRKGERDGATPAAARQDAERADADVVADEIREERQRADQSTESVSRDRPAASGSQQDDDGRGRQQPQPQPQREDAFAAAPSVPQYDVGDPAKRSLISVRFDLSPDDVRALTARIMRDDCELADHLASLGSYIRSGSALLEAPLDFEHTFQLVADVEASHAAKRSSVTFPAHVATDGALREASVEAQKALSKHDIEMGSRVDVYRVLKAVADEYEEHLAERLREHVAAEADGHGHGALELDSDGRDPFDRQTLAASSAAALCGLTLEHVRYMRHTIRDYERLGMHLDEAERARLVALRTRVAAMCIEFQKNLNDEDTRLWFTAEELRGLPDSFLAGLRRRRAPHRPEVEQYEVTLKYPHYFPTMKQCAVADTRRILERQFNSRCMDANVKLLEEAVALRREAARVLGYPSHAAYVLEPRMARTPERVARFLDRIAGKMDKQARAELNELRKLKRRDRRATQQRRGSGPGSGDGSADDTIHMWDLRYYINRYEEQRYGIDHAAVSEYFPLERVTAGMFEIYQRLLGLRFAEVIDAPRWHEDVRMFAVHDAETAQLMGYFYLDLHPREGKYGHAAVWPLQPSCAVRADADAGPAGGGGDGTPNRRKKWRVSLNGANALDNARGSPPSSPQSPSAGAAAATAAPLGLTPGMRRQAPVAAMVANFTKPSPPERPSLLRHEEVVTYFHEFGHVMHHICSRARFARFSGTRVERDFVEAPSQMLENWCWEVEPLRTLSGHYQRAEASGAARPEPLPAETARRLQRARKCMAALLTRRQVVLGTFDQTLHTLADSSGQDGEEGQQAEQNEAEAEAEQQDEEEEETDGARRPARQLPAPMHSTSWRSPSSHSHSHSSASSAFASSSSSSPLLWPFAPPSIDSAALLQRLQHDIGLVPMTPGTNFGASFGHLMGGYDAGYFGYLWSEVFSCDMYAAGFGGNAADAEAGARYRQCVLKPGGSRDAADMLRDFLGREPREDAFLRAKSAS